MSAHVAHRLAGAPSAAAVPFLGIGVYLLASIFYIFPSGTPQPADYFLVISVVATLLLCWQRIPNEPVLYFSVAIFLAWIVGVNAYWYLVVGDWNFLKKTVFYIYNMIVLVFVVVTGFYDFERLKKVVSAVCIATLFLQLALLIFLPEASKRATGTFNNPNQLGYWALLVMACLGVARERGRLGVLDVAALGAGIYVTILSLSRAATISSLLLVMIILAGCGCRRNAGWLLAAAVLVAGVVELGTGAIVDRILEQRHIAVVVRDLAAIADTGSEDVAKRGYRRLLRYPQYLAFGAGEGAFHRLDPERSVEDPKEFHSNIGNLLMSYGLVGVALFTLLLVTIVSRAPWASIGYLVVMMLYGVTHMGLRFSLFWVFLGLVYAQSRQSSRNSLIS